MKYSSSVFTFLSIVASVFIVSLTQAQDAPIFSQFTLNRFQFNPSYAAQNGYHELNIFYRKQWLGVENAPEAGAFNIQAPVGRNVSLGLTLVSNKTILLRTNSALATFAYRVRLGYYHHLNFGLAGGIAMNNFDLEAIGNTNDPALANVLQKSQYVAGQFGINYQFKNLNIGFALPNLFESKSNSSQEFQDIKFNAFLAKFGSVSYDFVLGNYQVSPVVIYRGLDNQQTQWEGMVLATYKNFLWVGASYRDGYGITGLIGLRLKGILKVGYAYEYPTGDISSATNGSHEIYLGSRFGKRDREDEFYLLKQQKDSLKQIVKEEIKTEPATETQEVKTEEKQIEVAPEVILVAPIIAEAQVPNVESKEVEKEVENERGNFYVVLGAYRSQQNALKQMRELRDSNLLPQMLYIPAKNYYYVYLQKVDNRKAALEELIKERERNRFQGVWIYQSPAPAKE